jgi:hypothetical protein
MKKSVIIVAMLLAVFGWQSSARAATCTATGFTRDSINMTAALINPPGTLTGDVDATGCNIGVYYDSNGAVDNANIYGANYFGVVVNGDATNVTVNVTNSNIHDIGEVPFNGSQHGVAIYYRALGTGFANGEVSNNTVSLYQKGGIVVNGANANVQVTDNTVTGLDKVDYIAQNGIQFGFGSNGIARSNSISDNFYTGTVGVGPNPGGENPPGWQYVSGGLLLYEPGDVKNSENHYSGNQRNVLMVP